MKLILIGRTNYILINRQTSRNKIFNRCRTVQKGKQHFVIDSMEGLCIVVCIL